MRTHLADQVAELWHHVEEVERRKQNSRRTGTITQVDAAKGMARVQLNQDPTTGQPYLSPWVPWKMPSMGAFKVNIPPSVGQQIELVSETGDLTDSIIDHSTQSDANPQPSANPGESMSTTGSTSVFIGPDKVVISTPNYQVKSGKVEYIKT